MYIVHIFPLLRDYIESHILEQYKSFDLAHDIEHVNRVIDNSFKIAQCLDEDLDNDMIYTIAAYHDIGLKYGRFDHELSSRKILLNDNYLRDYFNKDELQIMAEAVEDHRASSDHIPKSIYGKIVSDADRDIEGNTVLRRALLYGLENYPEKTKLEHYERICGHLEIKYGANGYKGYIKLYIDCEYNDTRLSNFHTFLNNKEELFKHFCIIYENEISCKII